MPDSQHIVVSSEPQYTHEMYNAMTGAFVRRFIPAHSDSDWPYIDQNGGMLTSVGHDMVRIWDLRSGQLQVEFPFAPVGPLIAAAGPHGNRVAMAFDSNVTIWDTRSKSAGQTLPIPGRRPNTLVFTKDGSRLYIGSNGGKLSLFDIQSEQELRQFVGHANDVTAVASSPNEKYAVSGDNRGRVIVWDVLSGHPLVTLTQSDVPVTALDWSSSGERFVAGKADGTVQIWTLDASW
jgi:WD40 repeat protein